MKTQKTHFIVKTSSESMPGNCWGTYRRVAVLEVSEAVKQVSMISERARGVIRVVETWDRLNVGKTERCAYRRALADAKSLVAELAAQQEADAALEDDPIAGDYEV